MRRIFLFCALTLAVVLGGASSASAQEPYGGTPPVDVGGEVVTPERPGTPTQPPGGPTQTGVDPDGPNGPAVRGDVVTRTAGQRRDGGLPVTGGDVVGLAALGVGAIAVGAGMLALRRRGVATP